MQAATCARCSSAASRSRRASWENELV